MTDQGHDRPPEKLVVAPPARFCKCVFCTRRRRELELADRIMGELLMPVLAWERWERNRPSGQEAGPPSSSTTSQELHDD